MKQTHKLLSINLLLALMIFSEVFSTLDKFGYFAIGVKASTVDAVESPLMPMPATEPEHSFLKYSLIGGCFFLVFLVSIPIVITKMKKSKKSYSRSSLLDLDDDERWDYINNEEEEIKKKLEDIKKKEEMKA